MAENLTQVNSYQDKLLEAMSIVSSQLISSIPYDKTITCTIIDDTDKEKGKYTVSNGDATFDAYSSDTKLKKEDVVYVTVPEGNYDNQKIIQGKKTSNNEKPFVFTTPFDTMLDLTDNLIIHTPAEQGGVTNTNSSLIANNGYVTEIQKINETDKEVIKLLRDYNPKRICHLSGLNYTGYTRLGLKAKFMSWLPNVSRGSYGLRITVMDNLNTTTTDDKIVASVQQTKTMLLDVSDMYGNPYNFENYYSQEKVFPIIELNTITDIIIDFYQIAGSFYDVEENILTLQDAEIDTSIEGQTTYKTSFGDNLFVDNVEVCLGYDVSEITDEYIVPVINDSMTYSAYRESELNKKEIDLRWVHQFADGPKVVEPESDFGDGETQLKDCEIRWYRYRLGAAAADEYSGVYWTGLTVTKQEKTSEEEEDKYLLSVWDGKTKQVNDTNPDGTPKVNEEDGSEIMKDIPDYGETQALKNVIFSPDTSFQTEQIKAIIFLNGIAIRGPVITFRNEQSTTGSDVSDFLNALEIECVDGTSGNYLIYNEAGNILNTADSQLERKLSCNFAETGTIARSNLLLDCEKGDTITWKIPIRNSMISLMRCGHTSKDIYKPISLTQETFKPGKYYFENKNKYEVAYEFKEEILTYYEKTVVDDLIKTNYIWTQVNEYPEDGAKEFELNPVYKEDNTTLLYYSLLENGVEYYRNTYVKLSKDEENPIPIAPYYEEYYEPWNIYKDINSNYIVLQGERTLEFNPDTKITSILYPTYKISALYSMYNMNNTIACTIRKDRMIYTTEKEFTFGVAGTMGSDKSLVVDFVGGHTAIIADDKTTSYQLEVRMYDENNKPEDISTVPVRWEWYLPGGDDDKVSDKLKFLTSETAVATLQNNGLTLGNSEQIYIAKVTVGEKGAELETYFPIPIKSSEVYSHIDGATSVIYLSNGEPEYYKGDYKLYTTVDDTIGSPTVEVSNEDIVWEVISKENDVYTKDGKTYRRFTASIGTKTIGEKIAYAGLQPISVYASGVKNYAVIAKIGEDVVWQQPILVIKNKYPSRVINKWDGKTLTMDKETGTILSTAIAAGRKDDANTFTGVMIGDWTGSISDNSLTTATGVFGYHEGEMSYALTDNGRFFIGKSGRGRINFDGNSGTIGDATGNMTIDLDDGLITSQRLSLRAGFASTSSTNYIILDTEKNAKLPAHNSIPNQHGQYPFEIGKHFKADYLGNIYAASGKIGAWKFLPTGGTTVYDAAKNKDVTESLPTGVSAGSLYSGSIPSQWTSIILDPVKNEITGGKFRASILEALTGTIKLGGYLQVYDHTIKTTKDSDGNTIPEQIDYTGIGTNKDKVGGGILGFMQASMGGDNDGASEKWDNEKKEYVAQRNAGIGISQSGGGTVKATTLNAGMSYKSYFLSLQDERIVMRGGTARLILQESDCSATAPNDVPRASIGYGNQWLACYSSGGLGMAATTNIHATVGSAENPPTLEINSTAAWIKNTPFMVGTSDINKNTTLYGKLLIGVGNEGDTVFYHSGTHSLTIASSGMLVHGNSKFSDALVIGTHTPDGTKHLDVGGDARIYGGNLNIVKDTTTSAGGTLQAAGMVTAGTGLKATSGGADISGQVVIKGTVSGGKILKVDSGGANIKGGLTVDSGGLVVEAGNTELKGGLTVPKEKTVIFTDAKQVGIRAQFA